MADTNIVTSWQKSPHGVHWLGVTKNAWTKLQEGFERLCGRNETIQKQIDELRAMIQGGDSSIAVPVDPELGYDLITSWADTADDQHFGVTTIAWSTLQEGFERLGDGNVSLQKRMDELRAMIEWHPSIAVPLLQPHFEALAVYV